jgi:protein ImuA
MPRPKPDLDALRAQIAALEKRPVLAGGAALLAQKRDNDEDALLALLRAPAGLLHEVFADEHRQSGTALGFTLGLARSLIAHNRQALIYLQLSAEAQEIGLPYGLGFSSFGLTPDTLVIGRIGTVPELLWALEEALACRAVAGVIVDLASHAKALDFTISRRISLRAAAAGTSAFLIRYGTGREASAARLRWHVKPGVSAGQPFDLSAPGNPRFTVEIEKLRLGQESGQVSQTEQHHLILDWTENGFVSVDPRKPQSKRPLAPLRRPAPPSRPLPAALGDRLSEAS